MSNSGTNGDVMVTGSEIVGVANNASAGAIMMMLDLNPSTWGGTRIARMVPLFETYKIQQLRITYIPACGTGVSGLVFMYYDRDPNDGPIGFVTSPANLSRLMSNQNAVAGQAWRPLSLSYRTAPSDNNSYFAAPVTDSGDLRLTSQGVAYAYTNASSAVLANSIFKVDYTIKLMTPTGPTGVPSSYSGFTYVGIGINSSTSTAPVVLSVAATMTSEYIYQLFSEVAFTLILDGVSKTFPAYTPYFIRLFIGTGGTYRAYLTLDSAIANSSDYLSIAATAAINCWGWYRTIVNIAAGGAGETN